MSTAVDNPTPYPAANGLLKELLAGVQAILGDHFIGLYLDGSLASGDFDQDSDIDFVAVTDIEIAGSHFSALQAMHDRLATIDSEWAIQLEGTYISQGALRRYDPAEVLHPNIERGRGERLKLVRHDESWVIHRWVLRERGIILAGPAPQTLIDPVAPAELRQGALIQLQRRAAHLLDDSGPVDRGFQSYTVLTLCRILYTLENASVVSKLAAARWAVETFGEQWRPLIEQTWAGRHNPFMAAPAEDLKRTKDLMRYALERSRSTTVGERPAPTRRANMTQQVLYPNWQDVVVYPARGAQPKVLVDNEQYRSVIVGLAAGSSIPPHPEGPSVFHFLEGTGRMTVGDESFAVQAGATVIVPAGAARGITAETQLAFLAVRLAQ